MDRILIALATKHTAKLADELRVTGGFKFTKPVYDKLMALVVWLETDECHFLELQLTKVGSVRVAIFKTDEGQGDLTYLWTQNDWQLIV